MVLFSDHSLMKAIVSKPKLIKPYTLISAMYCGVYFASKIFLKT